MLTLDKNMTQLTYSQLVDENRRLGEELDEEVYKILVLSNATIAPLSDILEFYLRELGVSARVRIGDYDNIVQDSTKADAFNAVIVFWEIWNISETIVTDIELINKKEKTSLVDKIKDDIQLVLANLSNVSLVIFNSFTATPFYSQSIGVSALHDVCGVLNDYLHKIASENTYVADIDTVIKSVSITDSVDWRNYYLSRSMYSVKFFRHYVDQIVPVIAATIGRYKKALILDCDNTLWHGVVGEDGYSGIQLSRDTHQGRIFSEIQLLAKVLKNRGVLLGLCSKNNESDVDEVLSDHPDMILRNQDFAIKKINWERKSVNLIDIAAELNIGLDSIVFVDDSPFEIEFVRSELPEVTVLQVPQRLTDYPNCFRGIFSLFWRPSITTEDLNKTEQYKQEDQRRLLRSKTKSIDGYLKSLCLTMCICNDIGERSARIAQLTQKTNQFNLTLERLTESDLKKLTIKDECNVVMFSLADRFGEYGLTGVALCHLVTPTTMAIDNFLMSCRILGRNVEFVFFDYLFVKFKTMGIKEIQARYKPAERNSIVAHFYDSLGFGCLGESNGSIDYKLKLDNYQSSGITYIELSSE